MHPPSDQGSTSHSRYVVLDGIRGIAAIIVMLFHVTKCTQSAHLFPAGEIAVDLFFCLSGFVLCHAYYGRLVSGMKLSAFALRRFIRLFPMHLLAMLTGLITFSMARHAGTASISDSSFNVAFILNLFYLPYLGSYHIQMFEKYLSDRVFPFNPSAWSLFFEWVVSIGFAAFLVCLRGLPKFMDRKFCYALVALLALVLLVTTAMFGNTGFAAKNFSAGFARTIWAFSIGIVIYSVREKLQIFSRLPYYLIFLLLMAIASFPETLSTDVWWLFSTIIFVPLLVAWSAAISLRPHTKSYALCLYLGRLSYPLYCLHYPILIGLTALIARQDYSYSVIIANIAFTLIAAHLALIFIDEPARKWLSKRLI